MDILARIPDLTQAAQPEHPAAAGPLPTPARALPPRGNWLYERSTIAVLTLAAAVIWAVALWQERGAGTPPRPVTERLAAAPVEQAR